MTSQPSLFDELPPYQRHSETSKAAAVQIEPHVSELHATILRVFRVQGPMTDKDLADYFRLRHGPETVRARRVELTKPRYGHCKLEDSGERRDGCTVWRIRK